MKVASVEWNSNELKELNNPCKLLSIIEDRIKEAKKHLTDIILFPAFTGCCYQHLSNKTVNLEMLKNIADPIPFLEQIQLLSIKHEITICPGSYWETNNTGTYHVSCIISNGKLLHTQKQIYLAKWEQRLGLSRGNNVTLVDIKGWKTGILLSTDVFYPQVSRMLAIQGADMVLSPIGFAEERNEAVQISGLWEEVQQNLFFGIESGFNGVLGSMVLWGESIIHAPLEMTRNKDGFLSRSTCKKGLIYAKLSNEHRKNAISKFNVLYSLNPECYNKMNMFGGK